MRYIAGIQRGLNADSRVIQEHEPRWKGDKAAHKDDRWGIPTYLASGKGFPISQSQGLDSAGIRFTGGVEDSPSALSVEGHAPGGRAPPGYMMQQLHALAGAGQGRHQSGCLSAGRAAGRRCSNERAGEESGQRRACVPSSWRTRFD